MKLDFDLSREQFTVVLLAVGLVVSAVVVSPGMVFGPGDGPSDAKSGVTYTSEPADNTVERGPPGSFESADLMSVPDGYTETSTPDASKPPEVQASAGAQTMQVSVVESDGEVALQLEDDRVHDGRWVSIPSQWFEAEVGGVPEVAYVAHSSGEQYQTQLYTRGGDVAFYVEEFSTNTVTFSGEVQVTGDFSDGGSAQYSLSNYDSASDPVLKLTGVTNTETETVSATQVGDSGTVAANIAGNVDPPETTLTFGGNQYTGSRYTPVGSGDGSISVKGDAAPSGPENGQPAITFTGVSEQATHNIIDDDGDGTRDGPYATIGDKPEGEKRKYSVQFSPKKSGNINSIDVNVVDTGGSDYGANVDVYISSGSHDGTWEEGTLVSSAWNPGWSTGIQSIPMDTDYSVNEEETYEIELITTNTDSDGTGDAVDLARDDNGAGVTRADGSTLGKSFDIEFGIKSGTTDPSVDIDGDGAADASYSGMLTSGQTATVPVSDLTPGSVTVDASTSAGPLPDWEFAYDAELHTQNPSVDVDGDGTDEASYTGKLGPGETADLTINPVRTDSWTVSTTGPVNVSAEVTERTQTTDAGAELNGQTLSHSGPLAEGETVSLTYNQSVLQEGTNQLNISVGDGTLSADAPTPMVGVNLTHDAVDQQSVDYGGGQWTEAYNVSETYASSQANAELTIPFQTNVYQIQTIEAQVNGSGWSSVGTGDYNLSETTLTVDLAGVYGDTIPEGTEMQVRTTGNSVDPIAGTVTVTDPTPPDEPLNSTVEIVDWGPDSALDISGTPSGDRVHYLADATWQADEYSDFEGDGTHILEMPNASADNSFTVRTLPLRIAPKSGDAHVNVPDGRVNRSEPVYRVTPGDTVGDAYDVTFTNASDGEDYILWSETNEVVVDDGTASSPLTLTDDEDNVATMQFRLDDGTSGSSTDSGDDSGGGVPAPMPTTGGDSNFVALIGVAIAGGLVIVASRNDGAVAESGENAAASIEGALGRVPIAGPALGKGLGGLVESIGGLLEAVVGNQTIALGIVGAMVVGAVQGGIIEVPQSSLTLIVVAGIGIYSLVALRELGEFTTARWAAILAATMVVTLQTVSEASLLTAIVESQVWPILALALVYLAWQGVQGLNTPDSVTNVQLETEPSDGGDDG